ncbi:MAG TPA: hypothetical protein VJ385_01760 [Fibrobacteria bacterium]|nr:hypothetical protein [Fibrobacteria bacterium]
MNKAALFSILAVFASPLFAGIPEKPAKALAAAAVDTAKASLAQKAASAAGSSGIEVVPATAAAPVAKDTAKPAPKVSAKDSAAARNKAVKDSVNARRKFVRDSIAVRAKAIKDSADARNKFVRDSTLARRKAIRDSSAARNRFVRDSIATVQKAKQDSLAAARKAAHEAALARAKAVRDSLALAKKTKDSLAAALKAAKADSTKAAMALAAAVKRANDSVVAARKAAHADSLKAAASRPRIDSVSVKRYRIMNRPLNKDQMKFFQAQFGMKDAAKPESTGVNWICRDKKGGVLTYEAGYSDLGYANETVPMLSEKEYLPDSLIRTKTDVLLKGLLKGKADQYVFSNYEITLVQKKEGEGKAAKVYPPVPAYYCGRYVRKLDERLVLGDAFQVRVGYGEGGAPQFFSFRDPALAESGPMKAPTKERILDSLGRWTKSRTRPRRIYYPYHPDSLRVRDIKPIKAFDSYVVAQEKATGTQPGAAYLMPAVTVLAEVTVARSARKLSQPQPVEPVLLHFNFPCRPESGLCWPDGKQAMQSAPPTASAPAKPSAPGKPSAPTPK